jgi:hypothetical protein
MRTLIVIAALAVLCASCSPAPEPAARKPAAVETSTTYLASVVVPLEPGEKLESFSFDTWGVDILAVCHIPPGWRIKGGRSAAPDGIIAGDGSHGVTWLGDMKPLESLVLVRLHGPVQATEEKTGPRTVPATFKGTATVAMTDSEREVALGHSNVRLAPADHCP